MTASNKKPAAKAGPKMIALTSKPEHDAERVELFSIDGKVYTVPVSVEQTVGLQYVHVARKQGPQAGVDFMMEALLGEDGWEALMSFKGLTEDDLKNVLEACSAIMVSASQPPKA